MFVKRVYKWGLIIFPLFLLLRCSFLPAREKSDSLDWKCPALPTDFSTTDLIGMWQSEYGRAIDNLVLKEDGKYDQAYFLKTDGYSFTNVGNTWWLEWRNSGGAYLHLDHMRRCDNIDELCERESGGGGDFTYWDFCEDRGVTMKDEVILLVTGTRDDVPIPPKGIWLWQMGLDPDGGSSYFVLIEN